MGCAFAFIGLGVSALYGAPWGWITFGAGIALEALKNEPLVSIKVTKKE